MYAYPSFGFIHVNSRQELTAVNATMNNWLKDHCELIKGRPITPLKEVLRQVNGMPLQPGDWLFSKTISEQQAQEQTVQLQLTDKAVQLKVRTEPDIQDGQCTGVSAFFSPVPANQTLELLLAAIPDAFFLYDDQLTLLLFNKAGYDFTAEVGQTELKKGMSITEVTQDKEVIEGMKRCLQGEEQTLEFLRTVSRGNKKADYLIKVKPVSLPYAAPHVLVSVVDVTELNQERASNTRSRSLFNSFMDNSPALTWIADEKGRLRYLNQKYKAVYSLSDEDLNKPIHDIFPKEIADAFIENNRRVWETNQAAEFVEEAINPEGKKVIYQIFKFPLGEENGIRLLGGKALDITEQLEIKEEIEQFFELSHDMLCIANHDGYFIKVNKAFSRLMGYSKEELCNQPFSNFVHPEDRDKTIQERKDLKEGIYSQHFENRYVTAAGDIIWMSWTACPSANGNYIFAAARDVTQEKEKMLARLSAINDQLEKKAVALEKSNQELERFAYATSHDLQEPLRMISGFLQLLQKQYKTVLDERALEYIFYATDGANRLKQLIQDLLTYSRVNSQGVHIESVDTGNLVDYCRTMLQKQIEEKGATIEEQSMPVIAGNQILLQQLYMNLIGNALKYNTRQPVIITGLEKEDDKEWLLFVRDNGIGIEQRHIDKIFGLFQRLNDKNQYPGTGLGLAICKKVIEKHGGRIYAQSEPGRGSTFYFTIPKTLPEKTDQ